MLHRRLPLIALLAVSGSPRHDLHAQDSTVVWAGNVQANGNLLYGAASQRVFSAGAGVQRESKSLQWRADVSGGYGDSRDQDTRLRRVIVRNARATASLDWHPMAAFSPFAFGTAESSLQQRIASRISSGIGGKWTLWRPGVAAGAFVQDASISAAVLAEDTRSLAAWSVVDGERGAGSRYRWSVRARYRRLLTPTLRFSHLSFYQPTVGRVSRYTLEATSELSMPVLSRAEFTITHRERLDSEARERGASSIRDGQLLFGMRAAF